MRISLKKPLKREVNINYKVSHEEKAAMQKKADKWAGGNLSAWVRFAAVMLEPGVEERKKK
jgi:hypothetical protein